MSDELVSKVEIRQTRDYGQFKYVDGNRDIDAKKVARLKHSFADNGNLTGKFPIVVNENMEIIDGQHRLEVCRDLGWPIGYRVQEGITLSDTYGINQAGSNWSWKDYAYSLTKRGSPEQREAYGQVLALHAEFNVPFGVIRVYTDNHSDKRRIETFRSGSMRIRDYDKAYKLLEQYRELRGLLGVDHGMLAHALYTVLRNPNYDHTRMLHKAAINEREFEKRGSVEQYRHALEELYNYRQSEVGRVRLF